MVIVVRILESGRILTPTPANRPPQEDSGRVPAPPHSVDPAPGETAPAVQKLDEGVALVYDDLLYPRIVLAVAESAKVATRTL